MLNLVLHECLLACVLALGIGVLLVLLCCIIGMGFRSIPSLRILCEGIVCRRYTTNHRSPPQSFKTSGYFLPFPFAQKSTKHQIISTPSVAAGISSLKTSHAKPSLAGALLLLSGSPCTSSPATSKRSGIVRSRWPSTACCRKQRAEPQQPLAALDKSPTRLLAGKGGTKVASTVLPSRCFSYAWGV